MIPIFFALYASAFCAVIVVPVAAYFGLRFEARNKIGYAGFLAFLFVVGVVPAAAQFWAAGQVSDHFSLDPDAFKRIWGYMFGISCVVLVPTYGIGLLLGRLIRVFIK